MLTESQQKVVVEQDERLARALNESPGGDCAQVISGYPRSEQFQQLMLNTQVDAVRVEGKRAVVTAHTSAASGGLVRQTPPAEIPLTWTDGRWLID